MQSKNLKTVMSSAVLGGLTPDAAQSLNRLSRRETERRLLERELDALDAKASPEERLHVYSLRQSEKRARYLD